MKLCRQAHSPAGLFWLHRGVDPPLPRVGDLLAKAAALSIDAALVRIENFDEIMRDLIRLKADIDTRVLQEFALDRRRWSAAPAPAGYRGWPVVRLNALPVIQIPTVCRRIVCSVGGHADVKNAVETAGVDVLATRKRPACWRWDRREYALGFRPYGITDFDLHTIETKRLRYDSGERGLLRSALTQAITRQLGLMAIRRGTTAFSRLAIRAAISGRN